jgi:signal recognition particle subunit SEC65
MRTSPNLEGAIKFAAENLTGPLSWDLKKLLWNIEVGVYPSMDVAIAAYLAKWKDKNEEFVEAFQMLKAATGELRERRLALLDEAVNVILEGTKDKMRHYAQQLRLPVMLVYAMGIMLPVIGLVMFPIVTIFMAELVKPLFIFLGYDVFLPLFLLWYMSNILRTKPATFSQPEISEVKGVPPLGKFRLFGKNLPILPFAVLSGLPFIIFGLIGISSVSPESVESISLHVSYSVILLFGVAISIVVYSYLDSFQKLPVRKDVERIEEEFGEALFQFGNQIASGRPVEIAVDYAIENMKNLKITDLFKELSINMKKLGLTFEQALFDKEVGVIWKYPSRLIKSVFRVIIDSAEKSVKVTALTILTLSRYLKGVKLVKEEITSMLAETLTSMRFLAMFLAPMISGVIVTMAIVIMEILFTLSTQMSELMAQAPTGIPTMLLWSWSGGGEGMPITPGAFQITVGLYTIETAILLSYFINRLEYGEDSIGFRNVLAKTLFMAILTYVFSWWISFAIFGPVIEEILFPF